MTLCNLPTILLFIKTEHEHQWGVKTRKNYWKLFHSSNKYADSSSLTDYAKSLCTRTGLAAMKPKLPPLTCISRKIFRGRSD
jgi:hypothetical protein